MNFVPVRTIKNEQVIVNLDHVVFIGECKEGVIVRFADGDYIKCSDDFNGLLRRLDTVVLRTNAQ